MTWGCVGLVHYIVQHASKKFRGFYFSRKTSTWKNEKIRKQQEKIETDSKNPVEASEDNATTCLLQLISTLPFEVRITLAHNFKVVDFF